MYFVNIIYNLCWSLTQEIKAFRWHTNTKGAFVLGCWLACSVGDRIKGLANAGLNP